MRASRWVADVRTTVDQSVQEEGRWTLLVYDSFLRHFFLILSRAMYRLRIRVIWDSGAYYTRYRYCMLLLCELGQQTGQMLLACLDKSLSS